MISFNVVGVKFGKLCEHIRKIANIEAYCPSDNVSELTARANDEGFSEIYSNWLQLSRINENDAIMVFSVVP